jgi:hypothetical protein
VFQGQHLLRGLKRCRKIARNPVQEHRDKLRLGHNPNQSQSLGHENSRRLVVVKSADKNNAEC